MQSRVEFVSPDQAEKWLQRLPAGYRINRRSVTNYRDLITKGRWTPTHQGAVFDKKDRLIAGGELLSAIADANQGVEVRVTTGEEPSNIRYYGRGRTRNSRDVLAAVCKVNAPGPEAQVLNSVITHVLMRNCANPVEVEQAHSAFQDSIQEVLAIKAPDGNAPHWRNATKAVMVLGLSAHGYKEKTRDFVAELLDRKEPSRRTLQFRRGLAQALGKLTAAEVFNASLMALAAHCGTPPFTTAIATRSHFLERAHLGHLDPAAAAQIITATESPQ